jgi:translocation and assembly module TamB
MSDDVAVAAPAPRSRRHPAVTAAKWAGIVLLTLVILAGAFVVWLNSDAGRRYIVRQVNAIEMASGLQVHIERIDGSIFSQMTLHGLALSDPQGVFFRADRAELDYRPLAYLRNHIDIQSLVVPQARLSRLPALRPGDPNAPLLPDIDIDIGRLSVGRLLVDPAVTGRRHLLTLDGRTKIADGRAEVALNLAAVPAPGLPGGDRLVLRLDAVPAANRLNIALAARGPRNGFFAGIAGLDQDIAARIEGRGDWASWQGRAQAALGGQALADLRVGARDGTFTIEGPVRPGLLMEGPVERLAGPVTLVNLVTTFENRRADLRLRLGSRALAVAAQGRVDLGQNRFDGLNVAARLLQPGAIAPNLSGRDAQIALILNGPFATPDVAYDLRAARLTFDTTTVEGLRAVGSARVRAGDIIVPVSARAARITGFDAVAGGPIANVTLNGDLGVEGARIVSDNLRVRADRIDARVAIAFDLAAGRYLAAVQGRVNNYAVDGVGLFDINTDLDMTSTSAGFGLRGRVAARSRRIDNATVADLLGGAMTATANVVMEPSGLIRVDNVRLTSPLLRVTSGGGTYRPNGALDLRLAGVSNTYGPLIVHVTGTASAPQVRLNAASPGFGVGLREVEATVRATAGGWAIQASGQSAYGPFTADVLVLSNRGPLTIAVNRLTFAGVDFAGRIQQSQAGPFVGTLTMAGSGIDGTVRLGAEGRYQRIDIAATANGARTPGDVPILIQRGVIQATVILYPDAPSIVGDAQLAGLSSGDLQVARARVRINYRGGSGQAQLLAEGRRGVPFRVAANVALAPDVIRAALQGEVNAIPFRFAQPAEIRREGDGWRLAPVTVALQQGRLRLAGRYGDDLVLQSRLDSLDLSILNAFSPELGIGGRATGSLDFAQPAGGGFPRAEMRLNVENFTRTGIAVRSVPVNLALAGSLRSDAARLSGVIRRGGTVIGRVQAQLQPTGSGSWTERLMAAPVTGGVRYNGPADVPMSFANLTGHQLTGPVAIAADFRGTVNDPRFFGLIRADNLTYVNGDYGTRITNLAVQARFNANRLQVRQLSGRAGEGTISGSGTIGLSAAEGFPIDLRLQLQNAQLARSDDLGARATGNIAITNGASGARIAGELELGEVRYQFVRQGSSEVRELAGVRRRGEPIRPPGQQQAEAAGVPSIWQLDLRVHADNRVFVSGMGLESEWSTDLRVGGTSATPAITGNLELIRGTLSLAGRRFDLQRGNIAFTGSRPPNPRIDIEATSDIDDVEVGISVAGNAYNPQIAFTSTPNLPQDEIVSRILFGSSVTEISAIQAVQLAASLNTLRGGGGGMNPLGQLRSATGIDRVRVLGADETTGRGTAVAAGMYISDDIYVEIITDAKGFTATQVEISLSRTLSLLSQFGSNSGNNVSLRYSRDY